MFDKTQNGPPIGGPFEETSKLQKTTQRYRVGWVVAVSPGSSSAMPGKK